MSGWEPGDPGSQWLGPSGAEGPDPDTRLSPEGRTQRRGRGDIVAPAVLVASVAVSHQRAHARERARMRRTADGRSGRLWDEKMCLRAASSNFNPGFYFNT